MSKESGSKGNPTPKNAEQPAAEPPRDRTIYISKDALEWAKQNGPIGSEGSNPETIRPPYPLFKKGDEIVGLVIADQFAIDAVIDHGQSGDILLAHSIISKERFVAKLLTPAFARDSDALRSSFSEFQLLEKVRHKSIVKYYGVGFDTKIDRYYIVMEFVGGCLLSKKIADRFGSNRDAILLFNELCSALRVIHEQGIIHCDITPDNIILRNDDFSTPVLIDFGIARLRKSLDAKRTIVASGFQGTLAYASPESFGMYEGRIGAWTDIFSLGAVLYQVACGYPAFPAASFVEAIQLRAALPNMDRIAPPLRDLLARMLEPDPRRRYQNIEAVLANFDSTPLQNQRFQVSKPAPKFEFDFAPPREKAQSRPGLISRIARYFSLGGPHGPGGSEDD